jgi:hypothetical protein
MMGAAKSPWACKSYSYMIVRLRYFRAGQFSGLTVAEPQHRPRTAIRGSVSTPIPRGWIALDRLLAETGIGKDTLNNLRQRYRYVIPRSLVVPLTAGRGGAAYYPPETPSIICRLNELRRESPNPDDCLWRLWLEGHPVDIRAWAADRLNVRADRFKKGYPPTRDALGKAAAAIAEDSGGRIRTVESLRDAVDVMASIAAGEPDASHDLEGIFDTLCKFGGFPSFGAPLRALLVAVLAQVTELLSLPRLAEIAAKIGDEAAEQARRDWRTLTGIAVAAASIDWNKVLPALEAGVSEVDGVRPAPPSWTARKAQRTRALPPPMPVKSALKELGRPDFRAAAFVILIGARGDPAVSAIITQVLALAELTLPQLPQRKPASDHKPKGHK